MSLASPEWRTAACAAAFASQRVVLRVPGPADAGDFLAAARRSRRRFEGYADPPGDREGYRAWCQRARSPSCCGRLLRLRDGGALVGAVSLGGSPLAAGDRAAPSCYGFSEHAGRGLVTEGAALLLAFGFGALALREVEAEVRAENAASTAMLRRLGFSARAAPARLLRVGGGWVLHERWSLHERQWRRNNEGVPQ